MRQAGGEGTCGKAETGEESTGEWGRTCKVKNREAMILSSAIGSSTLCSICEQFWQQAAWRLYAQLLLGLFQSSPPEGDRPAERCDSEYRTLIFKRTTQSKINFHVMLLMTAICVTKDKAVGESWSWSEYC